MRVYFAYLGKVVLRKPPVWITMAVYWLYTLVLLIIVPAAANIAPMTLWTSNAVFNLHWTQVLIAAVCSCVMVVFCFRQGVEEETELIILSKPIKRIKISVVKFFWIIIGGLIMGCGSALIAIFTLCLGQYDSVSNPKGMEYNKLIILMASIISASLIITLFYGSIGVIASLFANKLQVIVTVVSIAILMQVYAMVTSRTLSSLNDKISNEISDENLVSVAITDSKGNKQNYAYTKSLDKTDLYQLYKKLYTKTNSYFSYFDFLNQLSNLYNIYNLQSQNDALLSTNFGENPSYDTKMYSQQDNIQNLILDYYDKLQKDNIDMGNTILAIPYWDGVLYNVNPNTTWSIKNDTMGFLYSAIDMHDLYLLNYMGATSSTVWTSNIKMFANLVPVMYCSSNEFTYSNKKLNSDFEKDVFNEIITPLLIDKCTSQDDLEIKKWNQIYSRTQPNTNDIFDHYLKDIIKKFVDTHANKYSLKYGTIADANKTNGRIQYQMFKEFSYLFWKDILPNYLKGKTLLSFMEDMRKSSSSMQNLMNANSGIIKNPWTNDSIGDTSELKNINFLLTCYGYTGINNFKNVIGYQYINYNCFENANYTLNADFTYYRPEQPPKNRPEEYAALTAIDIVLNSEANFSYNEVYKYDTLPYVSNKVTTIVWVSIGIILLIISAIVYQRTDIK